MQAEIRSLIQQEAEAVLAIPTHNPFDEAISLLFTSVHEKGGKVVASGMGKAGQIALNIATTLSSTGTPSVFLHSGEAQHGDLGVLQKNDVLLLVSNSGKTREVLELVQLAKNLFPNIKIISITSQLNSPVAQLSNIALETGAPKEICPLGMTPTASTTVMTVMGDILVVQLMKKLGLTKEEYSKRHHGGYLGQKARNLAPEE